MVLASFDPDRARGSGDEERVQMRDLVGSVLLVRVNKLERDVRTKFNPDGTDCLNVDIASVSTKKVVRDQRIWNGAIVDGLKPYEKQTVPVKLDWHKGQAGYPYIIPVALTNEEQEAASAFYEEADPFGEKAGAEAPWSGAAKAAPDRAPQGTTGSESARW